MAIRLVEWLRQYNPQEGKSVVLLAFGDHIGGMTSGGLVGLIMQSKCN
jgi:hypothetical protein